ncbi:CAP domain-containing protein, partial [Infundibulicybe gibba]
DIATYLKFHNDVRAKHGAEPLVWDANLASKAQTWADKCDFVHSGGSLGPFGENLAAGTGDFGIQQGIESWTNEVSEYNPSAPEASHFTQVVWKASKQLGCAIQSCNGIFDPKFGPAQYIVCEYFPAGNDGTYA